MKITEPKPTSPLLVALAWVVVAVPLGWGVTMSLQKSLPLFRATTIPGENRDRPRP